MAEDKTAIRFWDGQKYRFCPQCQEKAFNFAQEYGDYRTAPTEPVADPSKEELVIEIARELYDRFVMGGWEPQDAYPQIREWLRFSSSLDLSDAESNH